MGPHVTNFEEKDPCLHTPDPSTAETSQGNSGRLGCPWGLGSVTPGCVRGASLWQAWPLRNMSRLILLSFELGFPLSWLPRKIFPVVQHMDSIWEPLGRFKTWKVEKGRALRTLVNESSVLSEGIQWSPGHSVKPRTCPWALPRSCVSSGDGGAGLAASRPDSCAFPLQMRETSCTSW